MVEFAPHGYADLSHLHSTHPSFMMSAIKSGIAAARRRILSCNSCGDRRCNDFCNVSANWPLVVTHKHHEYYMCDISRRNWLRFVRCWQRLRHSVAAPIHLAIIDRSLWTNRSAPPQPTETRYKSEWVGFLEKGQRASVSQAIGSGRSP